MLKFKNNILKIMSVFLTLIFIASPMALAEIDNTNTTTETVDGDVFGSTIPVKAADVPAEVGKSGEPYNANGSIVVNTNLGGDKVGTNITYNVDMPMGPDGKYIAPTSDNFKFGENAVNSGLTGKFYQGNAFSYLKESMGAVMKQVGDIKIIPNYETGKAQVVVNYESSKSAMETISKTLDMAMAIQDGKSKGLNEQQMIKAAVDALGITKDHPDYKERVDMIKDLIKNPDHLEQVIKDFKDLAQVVAVMIYKPPKQVVHKSPVPKDGGACAKWNAQPQPGEVVCDLDSGKGFISKCVVDNDKQPSGSYTTTTPDDSDPATRGRTPFCDDQLPGYLTFSEIMNPFGNRVYDNKTLLNNGTSKYLQYRYQDKFNENPWKSSWRGEKRNWNPFKDGNKLSGIPYKVAWTEKFDGWYDQEYNINPEAKKSIPIKNKAEADNNRLAQKYGQNGNKFKVFLNAPNKPMEVTALNLDTNTWDKAKTGNAFCVEQYELKVEPRYNILKWTRYRLFDWHHTIGASWTYQCVETDKCKEWTQDCIEENKDGYCIRWGKEYCAAYYTKAERVDLGGVNTKYPKGMTTEGPSPAGSIPPVYKQRRKYQYRTGALVEYHAMTRPYGNTTMIPVPNSKDTSKMKSGYGFGYTSGVQMITDYDRAPSTYKFNPVIIRPNKATNLNIRTNNYKSSYGLFDSNVRYDKAKNAPEMSSSIDKTFIEETLRGGLTKTTFKPSAISNVEKVNGKARNLDGVENLPVKSSLVRKRPIRWGEMTSTFKISSNPAKYYHAYWKTKGEPNLIPAYKPGPLHYVYLDYPSGSDYTVASLDTINLNGKGFFATGMNTGSIKIVGNMWEDSFSRPNFKK